MTERSAKPPLLLSHCSVYVCAAGEARLTLIDPVMPCVPVHAPTALHEAAPVADQVIVALCPGATVPGFTERLTVGLITGFGGSKVMPGGFVPHPGRKRMATIKSTGANRRRAKSEFFFMIVSPDRWILGFANGS